MFVAAPVRVAATELGHIEVLIIIAAALLPRAAIKIPIIVGNVVQSCRVDVSSVGTAVWRHIHRGKAVADVAVIPVVAIERCPRERCARLLVTLIVEAGGLTAVEGIV